MWSYNELRFDTISEAKNEIICSAPTQENIMEKIWLKHYPDNINESISEPTHESLGDQFESVVYSFAESPAFTCLGETLTYGEVFDLSTAVASYLQSHCGLGKGDRVALMMPNILQYPVCLFACLRLGIIVVNVNPLYTSRELIHCLKDSGAKGIIVLSMFTKTVEESLKEVNLQHIIATDMGDLFHGAKGYAIDFIQKYVQKSVPKNNIPQVIKFKKILENSNHHRIDNVNITKDDLAFLQYTGGTTGPSKGAMLTHGNLLYNIEQSMAFSENVLTEGSEIVIAALPLYHIYSLSVNCFMLSAAGAHSILIPNPRDINGFVKELAKWQFTFFPGVNTLFNGLLNHPDFKNLDFSQLKVSFGAGMAMQEHVAQRWEKVTGVGILQGYGLTETSPCVSLNPPHLDFNGSIGIPLPSTEVSIQDDHNNVLPHGEIGEICVRGPQVMKGYWHQPEETAQAITDGWLHTGDIAYFDQEGLIHIVDRKKDMILVSGFNVFPNEIESILCEIPGVIECAVIGVADKKTGEAVKAFIIASDPELEEKEVIKYCKKNMTKYKVPKYIEFREELPKTNIGKILRRELRSAS